MYICKDLTSEGISSSALSFISIADHSHTNRPADFFSSSLVPKSWIKVTWLVVSICLEYQSLLALPLCSFFLLTTARLKEDSQWFNEMHKRRGEQEKRGKKRKKKDYPRWQNRRFCVFQTKKGTLMCLGEI